MRVLLDMNIPLRYETLLLERGISILRWSDIGTPDATDDEIIAYASDNELVILTFDLDFSIILSATHKLKPSIVQIRASILQAKNAIDLIADALIRYEDELNIGAVLSINLNKARLHILPL